MDKFALSQQDSMVGQFTHSAEMCLCEAAYEDCQVKAADHTAQTSLVALAERSCVARAVDTGLGFARIFGPCSPYKNRGMCP